jgi:hypothetical protein
MTILVLGSGVAVVVIRGISGRGVWDFEGISTLLVVDVFTGKRGCLLFL